MKIAICSDKNSAKLKDVLKEYIKELGHDVKEYSDNNSLKDYLKQIVNVSNKGECFKEEINKWREGYYHD